MPKVKAKSKTKLQLDKIESSLWGMMRGLNSHDKNQADAIWAEIRNLSERAKAIEQEINQRALETLALIGENHKVNIPDTALIKLEGDGYVITFEG